MKKHNLAFIDLETTGLDPEKHEIIEVGGLIVKQIPRSGKGPRVEVIDEFEFKVKPEHIETAEPEALRVNGYNDADWLFASDLEQVMRAVGEKTTGANMVAQNVLFDWGFLEKAFKKTGVENKMHHHRMDVITIAFTKLYNDELVQRFYLGALADYYGLKNEKAHTALADIKVTFEIYKKLLEID
ncbi:MAG: 3'-5' exonuclease [Patescibacteria group bacterium]|nr:3'-5' exonuclease [Patescibacteria group bacterium]